MPESAAEILNRDCRCIGTNGEALERETKRLLGDSGVELPPWSTTNLFADVPVFISSEHLAIMTEAVSSIEKVVRTSEYRSVVLARAPEIARLPMKQRGVYFGYDFHLGTEGPGLIEINTNAGGPLLNVLLARAQVSCCREMDQLACPIDRLEQLDTEFVSMFRNEWKLARGEQPLESIAIVDDDPAHQFLNSEFRLFRELFRRSGLRAFVVGPEELRLESGALWYEDQRIDLVYNRLVDFHFEEPRHEVMREAYLGDRAVITPHPFAHALYADKRNLITLRDPHLHRIAGLTEEQSRRLLTHIPETHLLRQEEAARFWAERKQWFMKPIRGYGSKAAYRGDKLTRGTFEQILGRDYVAQRIVPPSLRHVEVEGSIVPLKLDVRCFVYDTDVQLVAARLYHGQTTNFRTLGGGFAPVYAEALRANPADPPSR